MGPCIQVRERQGKADGLEGELIRRADGTGTSNDNALPVRLRRPTMSRGDHVSGAGASGHARGKGGGQHRPPGLVLQHKARGWAKAS